MVLFRRIEKIVNVDNKFAHIIVNLKVDNKIVENISREIDKENYSQNCFCIEYDYDYSKDRYANASNIETSDNTVNGALTYEVNSYAQGRYASEADVSTEEVHPPFYTVYMWKRTG